jgi:hypothetical protein
VEEVRFMLDDDAPTVPLMAYVTPSTADLLRTRALENERSVAGELRMAIKAHLKSESPATTPGSRNSFGDHTADVSGE